MDAFVLVAVLRMAPDAAVDQIRELLDWDEKRMGDARARGRHVLRRMGWSG